MRELLNINERFIRKEEFALVLCFAIIGACALQQGFEGDVLLARI